MELDDYSRDLLNLPTYCFFPQIHRVGSKREKIQFEHNTLLDSDYRFFINLKFEVFDRKKSFVLICHDKHYHHYF